MMGGAPREPDWTNGPAKWAAVVVLGAASIAGIGWTIATDARPREVVGAVVEPSADAEPAAETSFRIDVNSASATELELLPQIGNTLAAKIVEERDANGPFQSVDDLQRVKGIGPKTVEKLRPFAQAQ